MLASHLRLLAFGIATSLVMRYCAAQEVQTSTTIRTDIFVGWDPNTNQTIAGFSPETKTLLPESSTGVIYIVAFNLNGTLGNHSAIESTFEEPCTPKKGGRRYESKLQAEHSSFEVALDEPPPAGWFFDEAAGNCGDGAVFSINPTNQTGATHGKFVEKAKQVGPHAPVSSSITTAAASSSAPASTPSSNGASRGDHPLKFSELAVSLAVIVLVASL